MGAEESGTAGPDGAFVTTDFNRDCEVTATVDGEEIIDTVTLSDGGATVELSAT